MRLFVAIGLPEAVTERLATLAAGLPVGRASAPETMHLTLAFLGEQPGDVAREVAGALDQVRAAPFDLRLSGLDTFGGRVPHVLAMLADRSPALEALHLKVNSALAPLRLPLERRRFRPHVTIARFGPRPAPDELARIGRFLEREGAAGLPPFSVEAFSLWQSELLKSGAAHTELARYPLG